MADATQRFIDDLITIIRNAEDPESVTNEMVAHVFDFLNMGHKTLLTDNSNEKSERKTADAELKRAIDKLQLSLRSVGQTVADTRNALDALTGDNASSAIDNINEIIRFLKGIDDSQTLADMFAVAELKAETAARNAVISAGDNVVMDFDAIVRDVTPDILEEGIAGGAVVWLDTQGVFAARHRMTGIYYASWPGDGHYMRAGRPLHKLYRCLADGKLYCADADGRPVRVAESTPAVVDFDYILRRDLKPEEFAVSLVRPPADARIVWSRSAGRFLIEHGHGVTLAWANNCVDFGILSPYYENAGTQARIDRIYRERATGKSCRVSPGGELEPLDGTTVQRCRVYDDDEIDVTVEHQSYSGEVTALMRVVYWIDGDVFALRTPGLRPKYYTLWPGCEEYNTFNYAMPGRLFLNRTTGVLSRIDGGIMNPVTPDDIGLPVVAGDDNTLYRWDVSSETWRQSRPQEGGTTMPGDDMIITPGEIDVIIGAEETPPEIEGEAMTADEIDAVIDSAGASIP